MELELVLSRVVLEEAIEVRLPAGERASVVSRSERPDLNLWSHASVPEVFRRVLVAFRS